MPSAVSRIRAYIRSPEFLKLWRYASVSVISTVLSLGLLFIFFDVVHLDSAAWCNFLATSITSVPAYYLNRTWAWGRTGKSHLMREVVPFWVISIVSIVLSTGAVRLASNEAHHLTHTHRIISLVVLAANFGTYAVLWVAKYMLFNRVLFKNHHHTDDSSGEGSASDTPAPMSHATTGTVPSMEALFRRVRLGEVRS